LNIFVTGATGYLGSAVAVALLRRGHRVVALVRNDDGARRVERIGAMAVRGELGNPTSYLARAQAADAIVHCAFEYLGDGSEHWQLDVMVSLALLRAARHGGMRFVYTSNAYLPSIHDEHCADEPAGADASSAPHHWRLVLERNLIDEGRDMRVSIVRPGMIHGGQGGGTIVDLFDTARRCRMLPYIAEHATNRWSLIHLDDIAALYAAILARDASGIFHAVDEHALSVESVARAIASTCGATAVAMSSSETARHLSAHTLEVMRRDVALVAPRSRALDWHPRAAAFVAAASAACARMLPGARS
jgi:nucleoside-diphosphate-sugar epimerase